MTNIDKFLLDVKQTCKDHGIKFKLVNASKVPITKNLKSIGYFDGESLVVSRKHNFWLPVLIHESCHMDQWIEKCKLWNNDERTIN